MKELEDHKISIILPTYNEAENIIDLINEIDYYLDRYIRNKCEFIVVDDDSFDLTWKVVGEHFVNDKRVKLIRRLEGRGLPQSIQEGIKEARGDIVAWLDCDFSHPPYKLIELLRAVMSGNCDVAVGSRFINGGKDIRGPTDSWLAVVLSRMMNCFISLALGYSFKDYTSGFVAAKREIFDKVKIRGDYGEYFIEFICNVRKYRYKIIEVPYYCLPRRRGSSKTGDNLWDYLEKGWKYILLTLRLKLKGGVSE